MAPPSLALAVDLGGTKLACAVIEAAGRVLGFRKCPVRKTPACDTLDHVVAEAEECLRQAGVGWERIEAAGVLLRKRLVNHPSSGDGRDGKLEG